MAVYEHKISVRPVLCHPDLNIPLDEDDFSVFATLLAEELVANNISQHTETTTFDEVVTLQAVESPSFFDEDETETKVATKEAPKVTKAVTKPKAKPVFDEDDGSDPLPF